MKYGISCVWLIVGWKMPCSEICSKCYEGCGNFENHGGRHACSNGHSWS